jgi:N-acyl-phosphatidylethanolamine-hydrolysing phospholipase D
MDTGKKTLLYTHKTGILSWFLLLYLPLVNGLYGCSHVKKDSGTDMPSHHTSEGFRNPYLNEGDRGYFNYLKMRYFSGVKYPDYQKNANKVPTVNADLEQIHHPHSAQVTWIGHATVLVQYAGKALLTDPVFSDRASPVDFLGPRRVHSPALAIEDLPKIDYVVISHNHYDHLDRQSVRRIGSAPFWLVPLGLKQWLVGAGIEASRVAELDWWKSRKFDEITITATPAQHWSARSLWDRRETLWASWLMQIGDFTVWYSGDTGYNPVQFKEIGAAFNTIDLGLISIGAYEPRWFMKDMHVNPEEAVQIHQDIGAEYSLGVQWGTFRLTAEPIDEPPRRLEKALVEANLSSNRFRTMKIGETVVFPERLNQGQNNIPGH